MNDDSEKILDFIVRKLQAPARPLKSQEQEFKSRLTALKKGMPVGEFRRVCAEIIRDIPNL
jgi:hypothetical protein